MKKAMISQPMRGKTEQEIREQRERAYNALIEQGYEVIDNTCGTFKHIDTEYEFGVNVPLFRLARSLQIMAQCDAVVFCEGWREARGCNIEFRVAEAYGLQIIEYIEGIVMDGKRLQMLMFYDGESIKEKYKTI